MQLSSAEFERVFRLMNATLLDVQAELVALRQKNHELRSKMSAMHATLDSEMGSINGKLESMHRKLDRLLELVKARKVDNLGHECVVKSPFEGKKRVRISDASDNVTVADRQLS